MRLRKERALQVTLQSAELPWWLQVPRGGQHWHRSRKTCLTTLSWQPGEDRRRAATNIDRSALFGRSQVDGSASSRL